MREDISLFRFGLISGLVGRKNMSWGEREEILKAITEKEWDIPGTGRSAVSRSTVLRWLSLYEGSGRNVQSLEPRERSDKGQMRTLDAETEAALLALRKDYPGVSLPVLLRVARERTILAAGLSVSLATVYRLFQRHGLVEAPDAASPTDRRRFECEYPNDLWQSDCMHGPKVSVDGRMRKSYLFAIIDDHSRLVPHAQFYLSEGVDCFQDCLLQAFEKRGLPRRLYVDNGSCFRSRMLAYACAQLGVALLHAKPYTPQGKGKIERFFLTVRTQLLSHLPEELSLEELGDRLKDWLEGSYHQSVHSSTRQTPIDRYLSHLELLRAAPANLREYFRRMVVRRVDKDRAVSLYGRMWEAPLGLIGKQVALLYHPKDPERIEVLYQERSYGFLVPLNLGINSRVRRVAKERSELLPLPEQKPDSAPPSPKVRGGSLFEDAEGSR